ncbi:MAG: chitobiase/beta-hexosaminidase C-terminal domain-containing protein [Prevotella sp.]|nr:chitobiase/beta-hexosaminidase C-terminal domain-containing protein [Prevotella sp.]
MKRNIRYILPLLLLLLKVGEAWGQTDYSGTYFIANAGGYSNPTGNNYYMVPAANPQKADRHDAYYSANYNLASGDPEKPFIATHKTGRDNNSIWQIASSGDGYYYIRHWLTGKYLIYEPPHSDKPNRKSVHLQATTSPGNNAKFDIQVSGTGVSIRPASITSGNRFLNPASNNNDYYYGSGGDYDCNGLVGVYSSNGGNSIWRLEETVTPPTFSVSASGDITITADEGTTIHYTTNGDTPTAGSTTYASAITPTADMTTITAIAVRTSDSKVSNAVSLPLHTYTYYIINRSGDVAVKYEVTRAEGKALGSMEDIPAVIRSPYLSGETVAFYSFTETYTSADQLSDENKITETPSADASIYVTYTTDHLSEKFLHLRGARAFNIKTDDGYIYDDEGTLAYYSDSDADPLSQTKYLWSISGDDPYDVQIKNIGEGNRYLVFSTPPTFSLAAAATTKFILMAGSVDGDGSTYEQVNLMAVTGTGTNDFSKAEIRAYPFSISTTYRLIDRQGKLIVDIPSTAAELAVPTEWRSPLVSAYHYYSTASVTDGVYSLSGTVTSPFDVGSGGYIYVNYDVSDAIDLTGSKTYLLKFSGGEKFYQENGSDGIYDTQTKAVYPYNNGDFNLYVYGQEQWESQLANGASTRTRWLWKFQSRHDGTDLTGDAVDPYHVVIKSYQNHTVKDKDLADNTKDINYGTGSSYLQTYKPTDYASVITNIAYENVAYHEAYPSKMSESIVNGQPTEYMILGTSMLNMTLKTFYEVEGERRVVNSFEQYWKNNPTVENLAGANPVADNATLNDKRWHRFTSWAYSAPWGGGSKTLHEDTHWYQTISMGTGEFTMEEVSLAPQVILLDQHGWEVMRVPLSEVETLRKYDSPMVEEYHWYPKADKSTGYHKYRVSNPDIPVYDSDRKVIEGATFTHNSTTLAYTPYDYFETIRAEHGWVTQDDRVKSDFYVTYTVKARYASAYSGAATAEGTKASAYLLKQGGKYAKTSGSTVDKTDAPASMDDVPADMQWYLRPNFDIDREMGYRYEGESGAQAGAKTKDATELDYYDAGKNGFDPYNVQIQNKEYNKRYFTANTSSPALTAGTWTGTSTQVTLQNLSAKQTATGYDQTTLHITNATFMVVDDGNGNMRLMPRFDHTKVAESDGSSNPFRVLEAQGTAATEGDEGNGNQTLWLELVPEAKEIHSSAEMTEMNGHYLLAEDFTFESGFTSLGTSSAPFTGVIDGQLNSISSPGKAIVAYANGAKIYNLILDNVGITSGGENVGAICNVASGSTHIYNCGVNGGEIGGTTNVGGIVGKLEGTSRVVNCYSYADIKSGTNRAGIVGNNTQTSTQASLTTMVMNCMFYGDIAVGGTISPIYGGTEINNVAGGMNNYNYYRYRSSYSVNKNITKYNRALAMEEKFINRFERYRLLLNSNKNLAAKYVDITPNELAKWVLETADRTIAEPKPYPVLKKQGQYPSIINYDAENAPDSISVGRLNGGKLGKTLAVTIRTKSQKTTGGQSWPTDSGSDVFATSLTLIRTDKDTVRYNFNYDKVQLPYYNDIGTGNYTENRVVTGWKITEITGGTTGTYSEADEWGGYNFADRNCTNKDLYSVSKRVFSQGAYWDVPNGVTAITIEPYWAIANYVSDETYDVVYKKDYTKQTFGLFGTQYSNNTTIDIYNDGSTDQKVYTSIGNALTGFDNSGKTVYDQAVVLVGNVHQYAAPTSDDKPYTLMSIDMNHDNEPDYSYIFSHDNRQAISPIRYDFLNVMGIAEAQIPTGADKLRNVSIFKPKGWFEITNTCVVNFSQFEYDNGGKSLAPLILLGGTFEQFVSTQKATNLKDIYTKYIHVGSNAWFAKFGNGTHSDGSSFTPHIPVSVTGGDYDEFYLSGTYQPNITNMQSDKAECYVSGGRFGEMAGASLEAINGDVRWDINWADITNFYGGGVNGVKPITGDIRVDMTNSYVNQYCGGPKFGDMNTGKTVTTNATDCVFGTYFGAGYGGNSYNRVKYLDEQNKNPDSQQNKYTEDRGKYFDGNTTYANTDSDKKSYGKKGEGVATDFDYEFFIWSTGVTGARFYVKFVSFSLATTHDVTSNLTKCRVTGNVYGGGSLGKVAGDVSTTLSDCTINGNVFGAGYSATLPKIEVRDTPAFVAGKEPAKNMNIGMFEPGEINTAVEYEWKHVDAMPANGTSGIETDDDGKKYVYTDADLTTLGTVNGAVTLTITGTTTVAGSVYGGGDESAVNNDTTPANASTTVTISGNAHITGDVFGGGNHGNVSGSTTVNIQK